jgi:O-antigen ligase
VIHRYGASYDDMAFNEYLQIAAELGLPGLALYLLILLAFFSKAVRALARLPDGLRRAVLQGCVGGVAAQVVDAAANGSWRFMECGIFFWLLLGVGVAVIRMAYQMPSAAISRPAGEPAGRADRAAPGSAARRDPVAARPGPSLAGSTPEKMRAAGAQKGVVDGA